MMSAWETSSESLARRVILADLILEIVDELLALSGRNSYLGARGETCLRPEATVTTGKS
jgi:hypothetical protein